MATLLANTGFGPGPSGGTSFNFDSRNAKLILVHTGFYSGGSITSVTDNKGNTYVPLGLYNNGTESSVLWCCLSPATAAVHNVTVTASNGYPSVQIEVWDTFDTFDSASGFTGYSPGPITPSGDNELIVTGCCNLMAVPETIDSGFTISDYNFFSSGVAMGGGLAYLVQGAAATVTPSWTVDGNTTSCIACFKSSGSPPPTPDIHPELLLPLAG